MSCVDACLEKIRRTPEIHQLVHENYRKAVVRRFPYVIFYEYAEQKVTVAAVFHTSQDPEKWRTRVV